MKHLYTLSRGAAGILSIVLVTTLVLTFMLTISIQVLINVKNAKLYTDFNHIFYATEAGMIDARMQLKKEEVLTKTYLPIELDNVIVERQAAIGLSTTTLDIVGEFGSIRRNLDSECLNSITGCLTEEQAS